MQGEIVALVHSHPGGLPSLSGEADRRLQVQSDFAVVAGLPGAIHKFPLCAAISPGGVEHGVTDCYTLFRDATTGGIEMPGFASRG